MTLPTPSTPTAWITKLKDTPAKTVQAIALAGVVTAILLCGLSMAGGSGSFSTPILSADFIGPDPDVQQPERVTQPTKPKVRKRKPK